MKRSDELIPLSREHHRALVVSKKIRDLQHQSDELLLAYWKEVVELFGPSMLQHFAEEEARFLDLLEGDYRVRFMDDHARLRHLLGQSDRATVVEFAQCLVAHVRFEERELFSWLEAHRPAELTVAFLQDRSADSLAGRSYE